MRDMLGSAILYGEFGDSREDIFDAGDFEHLHQFLNDLFARPGCGRFGFVDEKLLNDFNDIAGTVVSDVVQMGDALCEMQIQASYVEPGCDFGQEGGIVFYRLSQYVETRLLIQSLQLIDLSMLKFSTSCMSAAGCRAKLSPSSTLRSCITEHKQYKLLLAHVLPRSRLIFSSPVEQLTQPFLERRRFLCAGLTLCPLSQCRQSNLPRI